MNPSRRVLINLLKKEQGSIPRVYTKDRKSCVIYCVFCLVSSLSILWFSFVGDIVVEFLSQTESATVTVRFDTDLPVMVTPVGEGLNSIEVPVELVEDFLRFDFAGSNPYRIELSRGFGGRVLFRSGVVYD